MMIFPVVMLAVWLVFAANLLYGAYLVLINPENKTLATWVPLAIMVSIPLFYCLWGYIWHRASSAEKSTKVVKNASGTFGDA